jgi:Bacterial regulatory proteins, tetR family
VKKRLVAKPKPAILRLGDPGKDAPTERSSLGIGRRNRKSHQAILAGALKLVKERGYAAVTIEAIASEARGWEADDLSVVVIENLGGI